MHIYMCIDTLTHMHIQQTCKICQILNHESGRIWYTIWTYLGYHLWDIYDWGTFQDLKNQMDLSDLTHINVPFANFEQVFQRNVFSEQKILGSLAWVHKKDHGWVEAFKCKYPQVNQQFAMENHYVQWEKSTISRAIFYSSV